MLQWLDLRSWHLLLPRKDALGNLLTLKDCEIYKAGLSPIQDLELSSLRAQPKTVTPQLAQETGQEIML